MVVFVEEDWFRGVGGEGACLTNHFADARGVFDAIAVEKEEVRRAHHILARDGAAAVAGAGEQMAAVAIGGAARGR